MGYSARYHAASLAAVFLALAIGILIGVGFGSDLVTGTADDLERSLQSDLDEKSAQIDALEASSTPSASSTRRSYPAVVERPPPRAARRARRARGPRPGDAPTRSRTRSSPPGRRSREIAVVREPPDPEALASTIEGTRRARRGARQRGGAATAFGERSGRALVRGGESFDELRGTLLSRYSGGPGDLDAVVVVREQPDDLTERRGRRRTRRSRTAMIDGMQNAATGSSVASSAPSAPTPTRARSSFFDRSRAPRASTTSTTSGPGRARLRARRRASGDFGVKDTADACSPTCSPTGPPAAAGDGQGWPMLSGLVVSALVAALLLAPVAARHAAQRPCARELRAAAGSRSRPARRSSPAR